MTLSRAASTSLLLDSRGNIELKVMFDWAMLSGETWMTLEWDPRAPKRLKPLKASKAACAMPMELALSSTLPLLVFAPRSQIP